MTLQQCKDKVAIDLKSRTFGALLLDPNIPVTTILTVCDMAAELYRQSANEWISVKDRLPEGKGFFRCLVWGDASNGVRLMMFNTLINKFVNEHFKTCEDVTHWQPLPEPPKI